jgi:prepilin-type N-terminal cleavage/methylation domain-containing protein
MTNLKSEIRNLKLRPAFTLMELLIVIGIIAILAALVAVGMAGAVNQARASRTRSQINKIDTLIMERYEGYRTRSVRLSATPPNSMWAARMRLYTLRELMRLEMPDRVTDVTDNPVILSTIPSLTLSYRRLANRATGGNIANWTRQHQGSECLYLILSTIKDNDKSALEFFTPDEIGDVDGDGMKEILDGFGQPIEFLRWAPGYSQMPGPDGQWGVAGTNDDNDSAGNTDDVFEAGWPGSDDVVPPTLQTRISLKHLELSAIEYAPDPFDPLRVDPRVSQVDFFPAQGVHFPATAADLNINNDTYELKPLIFSAGLDKEYHIVTEIPDASNNPHRYSQTVPRNDPYYMPPAPQTQMGSYVPATTGWMDNITNHFIEPQ